LKKKKIESLKLSLNKKMISDLQKNNFKGGSTIQVCSGNETAFTSCKYYCPSALCHTNVTCPTWALCDGIGPQNQGA